MKRFLRKNDRGFTLIEVVVAMVILGIIVAPVGASLVASHRIVQYADEVFKARLAVTSKVEELLGEGIEAGTQDGKVDKFGDVTVTVKTASDGLYEVTVTSNSIDFVTIKTQIREKEG